MCYSSHLISLIFIDNFIDQTRKAIILIELLSYWSFINTDLDIDIKYWSRHHYNIDLDI